MRRFSVLILTAVLLFALLLSSCTAPSGNRKDSDGPEWSSLTEESKLKLRYATQFQVTAYSGGYQLIDINTTGKFLVVPEGSSAPAGLPEDVVPLYQPLDRIYLTATSAMDFFRALQSIKNIRLSGTNADG